MGLLTGQTVEEGDFISTSAGAGDSGKVPKLNAGGLLDSSFIPEFQSRLKSYSVAENMNGSVTPKAVCINADGNVQLAEADQTGILDKFIGFCTENITTAETDFINASDSDTSTLSFTANAGVNRAVIVQVVVYRATGLVLPTGVTYNGNAMTLIDSQSNTVGQLIYSYPIGTNVSNDSAITISVTGGTYSNISIQALNYKNVNQTTQTVAKSKYIKGSGSSFSLALNPTNAYSKIIQCTANPLTVTSWTAGQTQRNYNSVGGISEAYVADVTNKTSANTNYTGNLSSSSSGDLVQCIELNSTLPVTSNIQIVDRITFSGLTPNAKYYLSNTAGDISTSAGSTSVLLGKALSATELLIIQN